MFHYRSHFLFQDPPCVNGSKTEPIVVQQNIANDRMRSEKNRKIQEINQAMTIRLGGENTADCPFCVRDNTLWSYFLLYLRRKLNGFFCVFLS